MVQPNKNVPDVDAMCNIKGNGANNPIVAPTLLQICDCGVASNTTLVSCA
jgi:hypothetical protein